MINFGTIVQLRGEEYVFLTSTPDIIYLAKILNVEQTQQINQLAELRGLSNRPEHQRLLTNNRTFCFIVLETKEYRGRMAHLARPDEDQGVYQYIQPVGPLDYQDMINLKKEITDGPVPLMLKEIVRTIDIPVPIGQKR